MDNPTYAVTLATLRKHHACFLGYNKVVRMLQGVPFDAADAARESYIKYKHDEPVPLASIARNNGIYDAVWTLQGIPGCERDARLFSVWCVKQVEHLLKDQRSKDVLNVAERFANGNASDEELSVAGAAARAAAEASAVSQVSAAAWAAAWAGDCGRDWNATDAVARVSGAAAAATRARAWGPTGAEARAAQLSMFIEMCEGRAPWQQNTPQGA